MTDNNIKEERIARLNQIQEERKQQALEKVNQALEGMKEPRTKINFQTVAKQANVSVSYLYKYPEIKTCIAEIRNQQSVMPRPRMAEPSSNQSHQKIVSRLKSRIKQLEVELTETKKLNQGLAGRVYRVSELEGMLERQRKHIEDLETRLSHCMKGKQSSPASASAKVTSISEKRRSTADGFPSAGNCDKKRRSQISDEIKSELEALEIELNPTLTKTIKAASPETVVGAIEALKDQLTRRDVPNPGGYLNDAIKGGWTQSKAIIQQSNKPEQKIVKASDKPEKEKLSLTQLKKLSSIFNKDE
jgi:Family of unknown function (DUF6262)